MESVQRACTGYLVSGMEEGAKEAVPLPAPLLTPFPWRLFNLRDEVILNERATPASYNKDDSSDSGNYEWMVVGERSGSKGPG